jgi:hypothetical protein
MGYYHKTSPFHGVVNEQFGAVQKKSRKEVYLMDSSSHELVTEPGTHNLMKLVHVNGMRSELSDSQQYIKLFISALPLIGGLTSPGLKVFMWILANLKPKQDRVSLSPQKVAKELGYAVIKPVHDGVKDLINQKIIARAYTGNRNAPAYWINPTVVYNGNRRHLWDDKYHKNNI